MTSATPGPLAANGLPVAVMFPGQGSQSPGMRPVVERGAPDLLGLAEELLGHDLFDGDETGHLLALQPALYGCSISSWLSSDRPAPVCWLGHSLGEIAALAAARAIEVEDGLRIAVARAKATEPIEARSESGMLAISGAEADVAVQLAADHGLAVSNFNGPRQTVLSGDRDALTAVAERANADGYLATMLEVGAAYHSPLMASAIPAYRDVLSSVAFSEPQAPVLSCTTAQPFTDPALELAESLVKPVRWTEVVMHARSLGAVRFLEAAPGEVLCGLVRRIDRQLRTEPLRSAAETELPTEEELNARH